MIDASGGLLTLEAPYDERLVADIRAIRGRRWDPTGRVWTFPIGQIREVRSLAEKHSLPLSASAAALKDVAPVDAPAVALEAGQFVIAFPYDPTLVARVKEIPDARWNPQRRQWSAPLSHEAEVESFIVDTDATIDASCEGRLAGARRQMSRIVASGSAAERVHIPTLTGDLLPFQQAGVAYALAAMAQ